MVSGSWIGASILLVNGDYEYLGSLACCSGLDCDSSMVLLNNWNQWVLFVAKHYFLQDTSSKYEFVEVSTGAKLNRHNLHIQQLGPETETELSTLHLTSQNKQIHDLHSKLILDHPKAFSRQLHKCIACGTGNSIFDGNIKVNRYFVI